MDGDQWPFWRRNRWHNGWVSCLKALTYHKSLHSPSRCSWCTATGWSDWQNAIVDLIETRICPRSRWSSRCSRTNGKCNDGKLNDCIGPVNASLTRAVKSRQPETGDYQEGRNDDDAELVWYAAVIVVVVVAVQYKVDHVSLAIFDESKSSSQHQ